MMVRERRCGALGELHLLAAGDGAFTAIAGELRRRGARLLHERVFHDLQDGAAQAALRRQAYGDLADAVEPTWLGAPPGRGGGELAVQVHAAIGAPPLVVDAHTRAWQAGGLVTVSNLTAPAAGTPGEQTAAVYAALAARLELKRCARTWLWLDRVNDWYSDLNRARTACFRREGLIAGERALHLPASTGIGLAPPAGRIALEGLAPLVGTPRLLAAAGRQDSAFAYGSAFSRASVVEGPLGRTVLVSGTASIDAAGRTLFPHQRSEQVAETVRCVTAVLAGLGASPADIVQGVAYAVDPATAAVWRSAAHGWPLAVVLADVCRPDLTFEIEVAAWLP